MTPLRDPTHSSPLHSPKNVPCLSLDTFDESDVMRSDLKSSEKMSCDVKYYERCDTFSCFSSAKCIDRVTESFLGFTHNTITNTFNEMIIKEHKYDVIICAVKLTSLRDGSAPHVFRQPRILFPEYFAKCGVVALVRANKVSAFRGKVNSIDLVIVALSKVHVRTGIHCHFSQTLKICDPENVIS